MSEHSPLPWSYRPLKHDDWGYVRGANGEIACTARKGFYLSDNDADKHRRDKTDPYGPNAALIIKAVNNHDTLKASLAEMVGIYWGDGDGIDPPPGCIQRAKAVLASTEVKS